MKKIKIIADVLQQDRVILGAQMLSPRFSFSPQQILSSRDQQSLFLDEQRMSSMSDEGGVAAAIMESQGALDMFEDNRIWSTFFSAADKYWKDSIKVITANRALVASATVVSVGVGVYLMRNRWNQARAV